MSVPGTFRKWWSRGKFSARQGPDLWPIARPSRGLSRVHEELLVSDLTAAELRKPLTAPPIHLSGCRPCGIAAKVTPIRFFWIQAILHS